MCPLRVLFCVHGYLGWERALYVCLSSRIKRQERTAASEHNACQLASRRTVRICLGVVPRPPHQTTSFVFFLVMQKCETDGPCNPGLYSGQKHWSPQRHCWGSTSPVLRITGKSVCKAEYGLATWAYLYHTVHSPLPAPCFPTDSATNGRWGRKEDVRSHLLWCHPVDNRPFSPPWQPAFKLFLIPPKTFGAYKEGYVFQSFSN